MVSTRIEIAKISTSPRVGRDTIIPTPLPVRIAFGISTAGCWRAQTDHVFLVAEVAQRDRVEPLHPVAKPDQSPS